MAPDYLELIEKYRLTEPKALKHILKPLTSIPVNGFFSALDRSNSGSKGISLNISIPQIHSASNSGTLMPESGIKRYFEAVATELVQLATYIDREREVVKICFNGPGANCYAIEYLEELIELTISEFTLSKEVNLEIGCAPERLTLRQIDDLRRMGITSITINQYDYNADVLSAAGESLNRLLPNNQIDYIRKRGKISINLILSYGMPLQTTEGFINTLEKALSFVPDRLYLTPFSINNTDTATKQRINLYGLPDEGENIALLRDAYTYLTSKGYCSRNIYLYYKSDLSETAGKGSLQKCMLEIPYPFSFSRGLPTYGIGAGAESFFSDSYFINEPDWMLYQCKITAGLPAAKDGIKLSKSSYVCLEAAYSMAINGQINLNQLAESCLLNIKETEDMLQKGFPLLEMLLKNNILIRDEQHIRVITPALATILLQEIKIE